MASSGNVPPSFATPPRRTRQPRKPARPEGFGEAISIFIRARSFDDSKTSLTNLFLDNGDALTLGSLSQSGDGEKYLAFNYANLDGDWALTGNLEFVGDIGSESNSAVQFKISEAVVPLPAAAWLMVSGLAGVGYTAYRGKKAATA